MSNRSVHCVFCDDIRHEVGGKVSLMGCYNYQMIFDKLPITLPKLSVGFWLNTAFDHPLEKLTIILQRDDGTKLLEQEWPVGNVLDAQDAKSIMYSGGFGLSNLPIDENVKSLKVLFKTESEVLHSQTLKFLVVNVPDATNLSESHLYN